MLDMYMLKNGKLSNKEEKFVLKQMIDEVLDMFILQSSSKGVKLKKTFSDNVPLGICTDRQRLM